MRNCVSQSAKIQLKWRHQRQWNWNQAKEEAATAAELQHVAHCTATSGVWPHLPHAISSIYPTPSEVFINSWYLWVCAWVPAPSALSRLNIVSENEGPKVKQVIWKYLAFAWFYSKCFLHVFLRVFFFFSISSIIIPMPRIIISIFCSFFQICKWEYVSFLKHDIYTI